jgi:mRNA interferase MazF
MKQKEIWLADLNPLKGSEQEGFRPVVIVSGNMLNNYLPVVIACPLTSNIKSMKGNIVLNPNPTNGLKCESEVLIFHIRSISKERLVKLIGSISDSELAELKKGLDDIMRY